MLSQKEQFSNWNAKEKREREREKDIPTHMFTLS